MLRAIDASESQENPNLIRLFFVCFGMDFSDSEEWSEEESIEQRSSTFERNDAASALLAVSGEWEVFK